MSVHCLVHALLISSFFDSFLQKLCRKQCRKSSLLAPCIQLVVASAQVSTVVYAYVG